MSFPPQGKVTRADFENHSTRHENTGADEIDVVSLSGLLADDQHVLDAEVTAVAVAHSLATAANDFLVASSSGAFAKKTLAQTLTTLGKAAAGGLASLNASSLVVQKPADRLSKANFEITLNKLLLGAGAGADPTEINPYADADAVAAAKADADIADAITKKHSQNTDSDLSPAHKDAATGVHGVGASTVESASGAQGKVDTHANLTTAHSAVSAATASRMVVRDASARAKFAAPAVSGDALIKGTRLTANEMLDGTLGQVLTGQGAGNNPAYAAVSVAVHGADKHTDVTRYLFLPVSDPQIVVGTKLVYDGHVVISATVNADLDVYFEFAVPSDFVSFTSFSAVYGTVAASGNMYWQMTAAYGAVSEIYNNHSDAPALAAQVPNYYERLINVQAPANPLTMANLAKGDYVCVRFYRNGTHANDTLTNNVHLFGILFTYVAEQ